VGLVLTAEVGLFGYRESLAVPYATLSLVIELTGAAVLIVGAEVLALAASARMPRDPSRESVTFPY
jgi:hypothetical protein